MAPKEEETIISEVDRRLDELFGEEDEVREPAARNVVPDASPLKDLKATVLSIDWEITDDIMDELIAELESLKEHYKDQKIPVLFLKLISSLGKYIKTNKADAHPDAVKLLNLAYGDLERVVLTEGMKEREKERILFSDVKRFKKLKKEIALQKGQARPMEEGKIAVQIEEREVEEKAAALSAAQEETIPAKEIEEAVSIEEEITPEEEAEIELTPFMEIPPEEPIAAPKMTAEELDHEEVMSFDEEIAPEEEAEIELTPSMEIPPEEPVIHPDKIEKGVPTYGKALASPHEAFAFALNEIKEIIKAEFQALRAELRLWREEQ